MELSDENMKIAVAIRAARTAIGWSQQELADKFRVSRPTIARMETLTTLPKADLVARILRFFKDSGVTVDTIYSDDLIIHVDKKALGEAKARLMDEGMRRVDRNVKRPRPSKNNQPVITSGGQADK